MAGGGGPGCWRRALLHLPLCQSCYSVSFVRNPFKILHFSFFFLLLLSFLRYALCEISITYSFGYLQMHSIHLSPRFEAVPFPVLYTTANVYRHLAVSSTQIWMLAASQSAFCAVCLPPNSTVSFHVCCSVLSQCMAMPV